MSVNFSLLFYLKKQKNYFTGPAPVYLRITVNGLRAELATARECEPNRWYASAGRADGTKAPSKSLNAYLDSLQVKVYEAHRQLVEASVPVTATNIRNRVIGKEEKGIMLIEVFQDHNRKVEALVGGAPGTLERYTTSLRHTVNFLQWKYQTSDIDIRKIDHAFITEYEFYLRSIRKCSNNTAVKYIKNFGKIIRICLANGWLSASPFVNYRAKVKKVDRVFLLEEELAIMAAKEFPMERLSQVRDIFLFSCFTDLAYVDVLQLTRADVSRGIDGEKG